MNAPDTRSYYDRFSTTYDTRRGRGYHHFLDELQAELVRKWLRPEHHVLELGCGTGLLLERLRGHCQRLVGVDLSTGMLAHARARGHEVAGASVDRLPFDDASFDLVYSFKVLAHVPPIREAIAEFHRVLRPGGLAVLEFYNSNSFRALRKRLIVDTIDAGGTRESEVFTRFDSLKGIRELLVGAGFHIEAHRGLIILTPFAQLHLVPLLGTILRGAERAASGSPLGRFGGFLSLVARKA